MQRLSGKVYSVAGAHTWPRHSSLSSCHESPQSARPSITAHRLLLITSIKKRAPGRPQVGRDKKL
ncbi:hypothetical protein J6590_097926 [Homalodisca vitripennis]|nr:hypothetical protein J6590_097926 [Homalodisca vitripennis]